MAARFRGLAITFDDVLLEPSVSAVLPSDVKISTQITKKIRINTPIISAAMDTVTESEMAIGLARQGGLGVIHRNFSIEQQVEEVRRVKRSESGVIKEPVTLYPSSTLEEAKLLMAQYGISGIPIVNENKLKGILTERDLRLETNLSKKVGEVMTKEKITTASVGTTLAQAEKILKKYKIEKLPIVDRKGMLRGLITWKDLTKIKSYPQASKDKNGRFLVAAAIGVGEGFLKRAAVLVAGGVDVLVVDTSHAHHKNVLDAVPVLKKAFPKIQLIVGNVATAQATSDLVKRGVDAVKVGIGSGSICTTRDVAGVGVPQFTAILECARAAKSLKVPVIADGGIVYPADITKALVAGASAVMLGSMLAGTDEAPGDVIISSDGRRYKKYRGMGSYEAIRQRGHDRYFQKEVPEGISGRVPYKGSVANVLKKLIASLRTAMGYYGTAEIKDFWNVSYWQVTGAGMKESHPHTVIVDAQEETFH
ncbi:MAG: IMP dehydrogenase [Candidatus Woykebacteria bacterium]